MVNLTFTGNDPTERRLEYLAPNQNSQKAYDALKQKSIFAECMYGLLHVLSVHSTQTSQCECESSPLGGLRKFPEGEFC